MVGSGGFSIDLDRAPQAIADLRAAARVLWDESKNAWNLAIIKRSVDLVPAHPSGWLRLCWHTSPTILRRPATPS